MVGDWQEGQMEFVKWAQRNPGLAPDVAYRAFRAECGADPNVAAFLAYSKAEDQQSALEAS